MKLILPPLKLYLGLIDVSRSGVPQGEQDHVLYVQSTALELELRHADLCGFKFHFLQT